MAITEVIVNYTERNYFNDYDEVRTDRTTWVTDENVSKAIDKLVRRHRRSDGRNADCMFVTNDDGTGWRLCYDYDRELLKKGVDTHFLMLRHFTNVQTQSWDEEHNVSVTYAKQAIIGGEN